MIRTKSIIMQTEREKQQMETLKEDFERKVHTVVSALQEKAEENIDLTNKIKVLEDFKRRATGDKEQLLLLLSQKESEALKFSELLKQEKEQTDTVKGELNRRIQTITTCLNEMAEENIRLKNKLADRERTLQTMHAQQQSIHTTPTTNKRTGGHSTPNSNSAGSGTGSGSSSGGGHGGAHVVVTTSPFRTEFSEMDNLADYIRETFRDSGWQEKVQQGTWSTRNISRSTADVLGIMMKQIRDDFEAQSGQHRTQMENTTRSLTAQYRELESKKDELKKAMLQEKERRTALDESVEAYEVKLKDNETRMWENINKEAQRRTEAEYTARRLKKKVEELQFLLDELKDDETSDQEDTNADENNDSDSDKEEAHVATGDVAKDESSSDHQVDNQNKG